MSRRAVSDAVAGPNFGCAAVTPCPVVIREFGKRVAKNHDGGIHLTADETPGKR
jgi:hypothetical protein